MNAPRPPELFETRRLLLRIPSMDDARAIFDSYAQDEEVTRYLLWRPHKTTDDTIAFLHYAFDGWQHGTEYSWAITLKQERSLIGMIALRINVPKADFGFVLAKRYWNKGYMTEAANVIVDWAISQPEIYRVWALCDVENVSSARVLEKLGLQKEGILRRWLAHVNVSSEPRDCICYARVK